MSQQPLQIPAAVSHGKENVLILITGVVERIHFWVFLNQYGSYIQVMITVRSNSTILFRKQAPDSLGNKINQISDIS